MLSPSCRGEDAADGGGDPSPLPALVKEVDRKPPFSNPGHGEGGGRCKQNPEPGWPWEGSGWPQHLGPRWREVVGGGCHSPCMHHMYALEETQRLLSACGGGKVGFPETAQKQRPRWRVRDGACWCESSLGSAASCIKAVSVPDTAAGGSP